MRVAHLARVLVGLVVPNCTVKLLEGAPATRQMVHHATHHGFTTHFLKKEMDGTVHI